MTQLIRRGSLAAAAIPFAFAAAAVPAAGPAAAAEEPTPMLPEVMVEAAPMPMTPATTVVDPAAPALPPFSDAGDFLRSLPGVDAVRMGGHGLDPVIRGQSQTRLNIIADDAFVHGGCPNRMDPPTSAIAIDLADEVVVERGYQTVTHAAGGPGGTVLVQRRPPRVGADDPVTGETGAGYVGNGSQREAYVDATAGAEAGYARAQGHWKDAGNYEDGSGREIRSSFTQYGGGLELGWTPTVGSLISLGYQRDEVKDAAFAGSSMDAPETRADTFRAKLEHPFADAGVLTGVEASAYVSMVDHVMDNFSLRPVPLAMGQRAYRLADSESDTWGGRAAALGEAANIPFTLGLDMQTNIRDASRLASQGTPSLHLVQSVLWPDITTQQIGLFAEGTVPLADATRLVLGARYDHVTADWGRADEQATMPTMGVRRTPNDLYRATYGVAAEDVTEHNIGGLARLEHDVAPGVTLHASLARVVRTADATERGIASDMGASSWIGNPALAPEKHHQGQIGITAAGSDWQAEAALWHDRVDDFILRDRAAGQDGILRADGATIYRNIDAALTGIEIAGRWQVLPAWTVTASAAYTHGENLTDADRTLPQIPPLQGSLGLEYQPGALTLGGVVRAAATQTRIDPASGLDVEETSGWGVLDIYGAYQVTEWAEVRFGVDNLLDATYATHLAKPNVLDPGVVRVNEPGRSLWLKGRVTF